jgi:hypothetical protein
MLSSEYVEATLSTLSRLEVGQKLYIRMGTLRIDEHPSRIYRWFTGDSKFVIYYHLDHMIDLAIAYGIPLDLKLLDAIEKYKITYVKNQYVQDNFTLLQKKISDTIS